MTKRDSSPQVLGLNLTNKLYSPRVLLLKVFERGHRFGFGQSEIRSHLFKNRVFDPPHRFSDIDHFRNVVTNPNLQILESLSIACLQQTLFRFFGDLRCLCSL